MGAKGFISESSKANLVIFILIILYAAGTVVMAAFYARVTITSGSFQNTRLPIWFSVFSYVLAVLISVFHLSTMIRRRKRKTDFIK